MVAQRNSMSLAVLIPAYNAAATLSDVLGRIRGLGDDDVILIVDDGSSDATATVAAEDPRVQVVRHARNVGYGQASMTLYDEALRRGASVMVNLHADLAHFPEDLWDIVEPVSRGEADMVVGSRTLGIAARSPRLLGSTWLGACVSGVMPPSRLIPNLLLTAYQNACFGTSFHSFHDGFRACARRVVERIPYRTFSGWYQFDTNFLLAAHALGFRIREVGVSTQYLKRPSSATPRIEYGLRVLAHATRFGCRRLWNGLRHPHPPAQRAGPNAPSLPPWPERTGTRVPVDRGLKATTENVEV